MKHIVGLIFFLSFYTIAFSQEQPNFVKVKFEINGEVVNSINFANDVELIFTIHGHPVTPLMFLNGFIVPDFQGLEKVNVCFRYKKYNYIFDSIVCVKFYDTDLTLGIDNKPKDRRVKKIYTLAFDSRKFNSTERIVTVYKNRYRNREKR